jgi:hypothetical protein
MINGEENSTMVDNGNVWIGPTKCDDERISREKDGDNVWAIVKLMLEGENFIPSVYGIVLVSIDLIRESLNCFQNGAYLAACSMCRASMGALLYKATTLRPTNKYETIEIREDYLRDRRGQFVKDALALKLIENNDLQEIQAIWKAGDYAMHIEQKRDQHFKKFAEQTIPVESEGLQGWVTRNEALNIMFMTAKITSKVMLRLSKIVG